MFKFYKQGIIDEYFKPEIKKELNVPLLPSILYRDYGWREILKTIVRNKNSTEKNNGFAENYGYIKEKGINSKSTKNELEKEFNKNYWINKTIDICKNNNIQLILFTSPYFQNTNFQNFENFNKYNLVYFNLSSSLNQEQFFSDNEHLNLNGAKIFTNIISKEFLLPPLKSKTY